MSHWIFVMAGNENEFLDRIGTSRWPIYQRTNHRKGIKKGDNVLFYLAGPHRRKFVADAVLDSELIDNGEEFSIILSKINLWKKQILMKPLVESLGFIKNKSKWGAFMQGGIVRISDDDFCKIKDKN